MLPVNGKPGARSEFSYLGENYPFWFGGGGGSGMPSATSCGRSTDGCAVLWLTGTTSESSIKFKETAKPGITRRIFMSNTLLLQGCRVLAAVEFSRVKSSGGGTGFSGETRHA